MKNLKFEEVENILEELVTEYLHGIGENTDEDGNIDFGYGVGYKTREELMEDFILYIENSVGDPE